jgi:hypothetical protein
MPFVLDASVTLTWCFENETTPETDAVLDRLAILRSSRVFGSST